MDSVVGLSVEHQIPCNPAEEIFYLLKIPNSVTQVSHIFAREDGVLRSHKVLFISRAKFVVLLHLSLKKCITDTDFFPSVSGLYHL